MVVGVFRVIMQLDELYGKLRADGVLGGIKSVVVGEGGIVDCG